MGMKKSNLKNYVKTIFVFLFVSIFSLQAAAEVFENGWQFYDQAGNLVHAHGGGVIQVGRFFYWFGENRNYNGNDSFFAVSCYRSEDLVHWEFRNNVLTQLSDPELDFAKIERPKVIYNASTDQYVMWMHKEYGNNYDQARAAVAVCDTVDGDYTYLGSFRPLGIHMSRDCTLFVDDDATAYFVSASNHNADLHIYRLTSSYTAIDALVKQLWIGQSREAPCLFKRNGVYFIVSSGCTGWSPNQGKYGYATSITGSWSSLQNLGDSTTYQSQSTYVLCIQGTQSTTYLYMGDRWARAWGDYTDYSRYVWLPLDFPTNTSMSMDYLPALEIDVPKGTVQEGDVNYNWSKIDDRDESGMITWSSGWGLWDGNPGYMGTEHYSWTTGAVATFSFTGIKARYYGFKRDDLGYANIYVDGVFQTSIDCYNSSGMYDVLLYETAELSNGPHTLAVEVAGTCNPASTAPLEPEINIDAFAYYSGSDPNDPVGLVAQNMYKIVNRNSGLVMTVSGSDKYASGAVIRQYIDTGELFQRWFLESQPGGWYKIINALSSQSLDIDGSSVLNGADAIQWPYDGRASQLWQVWDLNNGYMQLMNDNSGLLLGVSSSSMTPGAEVIQWENGGVWDQQWCLMPAATGAIEDIWIEAESASAQADFSPFTTQSGGSLPEGEYIIVPGGTGNQTGTPASGICQYDFTLDKASVVKTYLLTDSPTSNDNSFQIRFDASSWKYCSLQEVLDWSWLWVDSRSLSAGAHTLSIAWREDGTGLDKIRLIVRPEFSTDFTYDGLVNLEDFSLLSKFWLTDEPSLDVAVPEDGLVSMDELLILSEQWLR